MTTATERGVADAVTERDVRVDLAAAHRLADIDGLTEATWNHFSHRLPGRPRRMLMTPPSFHWSRVRASDLVDLGNDEDAQARLLGPPSWTGWSIHSRLYDARPEVACVLHLHPPYTTALASLEGVRLEPASQLAIGLCRRIAYADEWSDGGGGRALEGSALPDALGDASILMLAHHGVIVVGPTIGAAYTTLYALERACQVQVLAMSTGRPLSIVAHAQSRLPSAAESHDWQDDSFRGLRAMLDATTPDYAD